MSTRLPLAEYAEQFLNTEPVWANPMLGPEAGDIVNIRDEYNNPPTVGELRARKAAAEAERRTKGRQPSRGWAGVVYVDEVDQLDENTLRAFARSPYWHELTKAARKARERRALDEGYRRWLVASVPRRNYVADYTARRELGDYVRVANHTDIGIVQRWIATVLGFPYVELTADELAAHAKRKAAAPW